MAIFKKFNDNSWDATKPSRKPGDEIGQYEVVRSLGVGGVGEVYLVKHTLQNTYFALKLFKSEVMEKQFDIVKLCLQEVKICSSIRHQNLVAVHGAFYDDNHHLAYIVMEYIEGCSLAKLIQSQTLTVREAFQMALGIAEALNELDKHNYAHCDVKPENIMMGSKGDIKLTDFGIAGIIRQNQQALADISYASLFSPSPYASPELLQNANAADFRSDIFSLGATLYHAVSGQRPFDGSSSETIASAIINDQPMPLLGKSRSLKPEYARIIEWMMEKDPAKRPQSYEVLIQMLKAVIECEQVRSPKTLKRLQSLMMKQRLIKRVWIEPATFKKIIRYAVIVAAVAAAACLLVNYRHVIRQKVASILGAAKTDQPKSETDSAETVNMPSPETPSPETPSPEYNALQQERQRLLEKIHKELNDNTESNALLKEFFDAAQNGNAARLMEMNIRLEPDTDVKDENGDSPAILAARAGSLACLRYLAKEEFDIYSNNNRQENILNITIPKATNLDIVDFIIHSTVQTETLTSLATTDRNGNTPLHLAAANKNVNATPILLKYLDMVRINAKNNNGLTALEIAVKHDNLPAAKALVHQNAIVTGQAFQDASPKMLNILKSKE